MGYFYDDPHEHPDTVKIEVAGKEVPWLITKKTIELGQDRGIDLDELGALDDDMPVSEALEKVVDMLVLGRIVFMEAGHERPNRDDFEEVIGPNSIPSIMGQVNAAFMGVEDGEVPDEVKKAMEAAEALSSTSTQPNGSATATATD